LQGLQGRSNIDKNTPTACLTATQETTGTAADTYNGRDAKTGGNICRKRDTTAENPGEVDSRKNYIIR
jgi:hypothetical protein